MLRRAGCLTAAIVLGWCFGNPESLLSGATQDRSEPVQNPDALSRLQLTQAVQRAKYAIAWERVWPHLARLLTVAGLFLVVSWAGLWLALRGQWEKSRRAAPADVDWDQLFQSMMAQTRDLDVAGAGAEAGAGI